VLTVGSLFAGIGGFDLGLERAGMRTVWFCEQDPYCQRVLARHWPGVPIHDDVRALVADTGRERVERGRAHRDMAGAPRAREGEGSERQRLRDAAGDSGEARSLPVPVPYVDVLAGGFPCQDLSYAGKGAGIDGARSGLWGEYARLIGELRPRYVIVENVAALLARGMGRVLGDLAALGYDAEWDCIPASAVGAPHRRDRLWLVAYPARDLPAGTAATRAERQRAGKSGESGGAWRCADASAYAERAGLARWERGAPAGTRSADRTERRGELASNHWAVEPDVGRVAHGIPARVDRLRALGNALVPQIAEWLGRRIVAYEEGRLAA
jgi:DNA (cytosine-5)-methyltransferase 1